MLTAAASPAALKRIVPNVAAQYKPLLVWDPSGEKANDLVDRCHEFMNRLVKHLNETAPDIDTVLLVSHAAPRICLGWALLGGDTDTPLRTGTCSVDKFVCTGDGNLGTWHLEYTGRTDFLSEGEEMHWDFSMSSKPGSTEDALSRRKQLSAL
jgi:transcription factor C subunit 7